MKTLVSTKTRSLIGVRCPMAKPLLVDGIPVEAPAARVAGLLVPEVLEPPGEVLAGWGGREALKVFPDQRVEAFALLAGNFSGAFDEVVVDGQGHIHCVHSLCGHGGRGKSGMA